MKKSKNTSTYFSSKEVSAFNRGKKDFYKGNLNNPYPTDTMMGKEWERGFNTSYFENINS